MTIQINFHFHEAKKCVECDKKISFSLKKSQKKYCSNRCRERAGERNKRLRKKIFVDGFKDSCELCGYGTYKGALDFHHRDPGDKSFNIADYENYSYDKLENEIKKCIVLCRNCHSEVHAGISCIE